MASFLGSENEKIAQSISQSDFACELKKHIPAPANGATIPGDASQLRRGKVQNANAPDPKHRPHPPKRSQLRKQNPRDRPRAKQGKGATGTRTKMDSIKAKAKQEASLFIANPIADTILGDLQCPAEIRKACKGNSESGRLDFDQGSEISPGYSACQWCHIPARVPAEHAHALVESIIAKESGTSQQGLASGGTLRSSIQVKSEGSYTPDEFMGLLEKVLQTAATQQERFDRLRDTIRFGGTG